MPPCTDGSFATKVTKYTRKYMKTWHSSRYTLSDDSSNLSSSCPGGRNLSKMFYCAHLSRLAEQPDTHSLNFRLLQVYLVSSSHLVYLVHNPAGGGIISMLAPEPCSEEAHERFEENDFPLHCHSRVLPDQFEIELCTAWMSFCIRPMLADSDPRLSSG